MSDLVSISNPVILGVDLGTTNSCATVYINNAINFIDLEAECKTMPSAVRFVDRKLDDVTVGSSAKRHAITKQNEVFTSFKTLMQDELWQNDSKLSEKFKFGDVQLVPTDIAARVLSCIREAAQNSKFGNSGSIDKLMICVPAASTPYYVKEVMKAAVEAGFGIRDNAGEVEFDNNGFPRGVYIVKEPVAAAYAYGMKNGFFDYTKSKEQNIMVYDFGGGTFDVSILNVVSEKGKDPEFKLLGTKGVIHLGGDDIDMKLMEIVAKQFYKETGIDLLDMSKDNKANTKNDLLRAQSSLKVLAEAAKVDFSAGYSEAHFEQLAIIQDKESGDDCNLDMVVTREQFLDTITPLLSRTIECVKDALTESGLAIDEINRVVLVGGSSKGPWVREAILAAFGKEPYVADNVATIVAEGAGRKAASIPTIPPHETKTSHHMGVEIKGGYFVPLIEKGLVFDEEHQKYSGSFKCTNSNDSGRVYITGWSTQENVIERDEKGNLSSACSVHYEKDGAKVFSPLGEFEISVPSVAAYTLDITLTMTVFSSNAINLEVQVGDEEPKKQDW